MSSVIHQDADASVSLHEPSLEAILADPLVALILRRDGLTPGSVRSQLERERHRLAGRMPTPCLRCAA